ncbi:MAG: DNA repair protein RecO [Verrucomicrobiota bacterium]
MDQRATGIILRTRPLTETSLIVHWLTPDLGRLSTVAKGARRPKSPFLGKLDLFYLADFSFYPSRRGELHTLREVTVREYQPDLRRELACLEQASYFTQLIEQATEVNTPLPEAYALMQAALRLLPRSAPTALTVYAFEMKLLDQLGLSPELSQSNLTAGAREMLKLLRASPLDASQHVKASLAQLAEIDRFLRDFLSYHLNWIPKGREAAREAGRRRIPTATARISSSAPEG